jgi:hypothetical protein
LESVQRGVIRNDLLYVTTCFTVGEIVDGSNIYIMKVEWSPNSFFSLGQSICKLRSQKLQPHIQLLDYANTNTFLYFLFHSTKKNIKESHRKWIYLSIQKFCIAVCNQVMTDTDVLSGDAEVWSDAKLFHSSCSAEMLSRLPSVPSHSIVFVHQMFLS